jgi:UPF0716 protein FxsA
VPALLVLALVVVPIVEIYVLLQVGQLLGVLPTVVLLVVMSLLGAWLLRREGARTWRAFREALARGRLPAAEVADGALVILGGALLLTPGFATDAVGLLCVLPPTRAVLRRLLTQLVARRLTAGGVLGGLAAEGLRRPSSSRVRPPRRGAGDVVDGEVVRDPDDPPGRPGGPLPPA